MTNSSIKFLDLCDTLFAKNLFFSGYLPTASAKIQRERFTKFDNKFAMPFLYEKIGRELAAQVEQPMSCNYPFITIPFKQLVSGFFECGGACTAKSFLKPIKETYIGIRNFKDTAVMAVFIAIARLVFKFTSMKASFSVDYTGEISKMKRIVYFRFIKNAMFMINVIELHRPPMVTSSLTSIHLVCI